MKKKIIVGVIVSVIIIVSCFVVFIFLDGGKEEGDSYDQNITILNDTHPTKIIVLGDEIKFRPELHFEKVDKISQGNLILDKTHYERIVLIINDLSGNTVLTDDEYNMILRAVESDDIDFYYLGTNKVAELISHGIWQGELSEADYAIGTALYYKTKSYFKGFWTQYDIDMTQGNEEALGMILISQVVRCIKSNY